MITATQFIELQAGDPSGLWIGRMNGVRVSVITKVQKNKIQLNVFLVSYEKARGVCPPGLPLCSLFIHNGRFIPISPAVHYHPASGQ